MSFYQFIIKSLLSYPLARNLLHSFSACTTYCQRPTKRRHWQNATNWLRFCFVLFPWVIIDLSRLPRDAFRLVQRDGHETAFQALEKEAHCTDFMWRWGDVFVQSRSVLKRSWYHIIESTSSTYCSMRACSIFYSQWILRQTDVGLALCACDVTDGLGLLIVV